ncbi:Coenzyme F420 hydrogenase/dehydrogenase, beta subunit C-terminal domain [Streptomyces sp. ISL-90]|nr:Coenzyme F420 hydrogenase/dehydrogenase, beta subunit C-terminal domain [Streptomyces sp. ISL-90]
MSQDGYVRPVVTEGASRDIARGESKIFKSVCPGIRLDAPATKSARHHEVFGAYISAWEAVAVNPEIREAGSSAGVLTALSGWLVEDMSVPAMAAAAMDDEAPRRTVPVRIMTKEQALAASGSRYAPVATLDGWSPDSGAALCAKPCEVSAAQRISTARGQAAPVMLSFFCAGTPSQNATDELISSFGVAPESAESVHYRGDGWPGRFRVVGKDGTEGSLSYEESWGNHLGRQLQWRCRLCVDGTGGHADIAVGDFWASDEQGYPQFADAAGNSVAIARTARGERLLLEAANAGVVQLKPLELDRVATVQPLQTQRRRSIAARILGRRLAGYRAPRYRGYGIVANALRNPELSLRALAGTFLRSLKSRRSK